MNYKIIYNENRRRYYIKYQEKIFGIKMWFYANHCYRWNSILKRERKLYSKEWFWLSLPIMIVTLIPIILIMIDLLDDNGSLRAIFNSEDWAKSTINEMKTIQDKVKKPNKVIGIYMGDEYIDGERLERMKKLERIVE